MTRVEKSANGSIAGDLDLSCGGLLPLIGAVEGAPAICDDRSDIWLTREEVRTASLHLAEKIASERKRLVFLFCGVNSVTVIGLLAAAAAGHATALIDPSLPEDVLNGLIEAIPGDKRKSLEAQIAMGRVGASQDVANTILFLASDLSSYVTGQIIGVDGGLII